jgi:hypothetical protein
MGRNRKVSRVAESRLIEEANFLIDLIRKYNQLNPKYYLIKLIIFNTFIFLIKNITKESKYNPIYTAINIHLLKLGFTINDITNQYREDYRTVKNDRRVDKKELDNFISFTNNIILNKLTGEEKVLYHKLNDINNIAKEC